MKGTLGIDIDKREEAKILKWLQNEILIQMYDRIQRNESHILAYIRESVKDFVMNSPKMIRLLSSDDLRGALGVHAGEVDSTVREIVKRVSEGLYIQVFKNPDNITIKFGAITRDYSDLLTIDEAHFTSIGKSKEEITWLQWLLIEGDKVLFDGYNVLKLKKVTDKSRTERYIMKKIGSSFRISPLISGTEDRNFLTEAIMNVCMILEHELVRILT
jgi:hypothetical protein